MEDMLMTGATARVREPEVQTERSTPAAERPRPSDDDIARRAYERYEARGREDGRALDDWLDAERDLSAAEARQR